MTNVELSTLAARYATAALGVWGEPLSTAACKQLTELILFYKNNRSLLFFLQMPLFSYEQKRGALMQMRIRYGLPVCLDSITLLLLDHHRIFILPLVYAQLIDQSYKLAGMTPCTVTTAIPVSELYRKICTDFIQQICTKKVLITWHVDPSLIAGMRIQTKEGLWEHSVDAQLRAIANTVLI